ncbi:MAG: ATP synthase subunit I [Oceanospirillaceae bacterium]|jgi:F0F1-type ATP synthase assembly protein I|nr:ATP synthase subunit I [Oceanospirillaceae bacterium]MBT4444094.1 ATP synthase subunit I [Oceanospirillaceae bacterium]MBT6076335.1 ATP synthase subunit I [Oceanospirillaceae bacterium]MBT7329529.1 ATP synthase subunit I [Oceanospirillaceae bacterium]
MALNKAPHWLQKTLTYQVLIVALIGVGLSITDWVAAMSVILGGAIYSLPAYWALKREFKRKQPTADAKQTLAQMYGNEMLKLVLTVALFSLAFGLVKPLNPLALLLAFVGSHLLAIMLPVVIDKQTSTKSK